MVTFPGAQHVACLSQRQGLRVYTAPRPGPSRQSKGEDKVQVSVVSLSYSGKTYLRTGGMAQKDQRLKHKNTGVLK